MNCICRELIYSKNFGEDVKCSSKDHVCCCRKIFEFIQIHRRGEGICLSNKSHDCICDVCPPNICSAYNHKNVNNSTVCTIS